MLTAARTLVQIRPAMRAQAPALRTAQRRHRHGQPEILSDNFGEIQDVLPIRPGSLIFAVLARDSGSRGYLYRGAKLFLYLDLHGHRDQHTTPPARQAHFSAQVPHHEHATVRAHDPDLARQRREDGKVLVNLSDILADVVHPARAGSTMV